MPDLMTDVAWPVRTDRLVLRPLTVDDAEALWAYRGLPAVDHWGGQRYVDVDDLRERFLRPESVARQVGIERDGALVGDVMVAVQDGWGQSDVLEAARGTEAVLGWSLDPAHQGQGFATEALRAVLALCFGPLGLRRVIATCFSGNQPSRRMMERLGMRLETTGVADSLHRELGWSDSLTYALLADEWAARRRVEDEGPSGSS